MNVHKIELKFWRYVVSISIYTKCDYPSSYWIVPNPISKSYWFSLNMWGTMLRIILRVRQNLKGFEVYDVEWVPKIWVLKDYIPKENTGRLFPFWGTYKVRNKQELIKKLEDEETEDSEFVPARYCNVTPQPHPTN